MSVIRTVKVDNLRATHLLYSADCVPSAYLSTFDPPDPTTSLPTPFATVDVALLHGSGRRFVCLALLLLHVACANVKLAIFVEITLVWVMGGDVRFTLWGGFKIFHNI